MKIKLRRLNYTIVCSNELVWNWFFFYRVTCRSGMCTTPLHVTSSQLIASEIFPVVVVKGLLYPGAAVNGLIHNMTVPSWDSLLDLYNLTGVKEASAVTDLQRLEVWQFYHPTPFVFWLLSIEVSYTGLKVKLNLLSHSLELLD